ncbi:MAG: epimerase [Flavobacteriales bacterium]|nr:epimerase [Flavobacteriales bacterium]
MITGASGMVGKSVLLESLENPLIEKLLLINRKKLNINHPKIEEIILEEFINIETLRNQLKDYDACFFCMGVSALGMSEDQYTHITYEITKSFVDTLYEVNQNITFNYVSGTATDSSEKGTAMWARVKGRTENYILNKGFSDAYMFRPGAIIPEKGIKSSTKWYNTIYVITKPLFPILKMNKNITTTTRFGKAMINSLVFPQNLKHLENKDINILSKKSSK